MDEQEYFIDFNTKISPGKLQAVRVLIGLVTIAGEDLDRPINIALCEHPLYDELQKYVKANPR